MFKDFCETFQKENWLSKCYYLHDFGPHILKFFYIRGKNEGLEPHVKETIAKGSSEYLVDLCWTTGYYDKKAVGYWIELALESELGDQSRDGIWHDFIKLMDVKANLKVGIFRPSKREREEILEMFRDEIDGHRIKNPQEQYLIIFLFHRPDTKPTKLEISGYRFDYLGNYEEIGTELFPWSARE